MPAYLPTCLPAYLPTHLPTGTLIGLEQARPVLQTEWGFSEGYARRGGVTALFWGPPGAGKRTAAEALAFELGKPIRIVHFAALVGGSRRAGAAGSVSAISAVFKEGRE